MAETGQAAGPVCCPSSGLRYHVIIVATLFRLESAATAPARHTAMMVMVTTGTPRPSVTLHSGAATRMLDEWDSKRNIQCRGTLGRIAVYFLGNLPAAAACTSGLLIRLSHPATGNQQQPAMHEGVVLCLLWMPRPSCKSRHRTAAGTRAASPTPNHRASSSPSSSWP